MSWPPIYCVCGQLRLAVSMCWWIQSECTQVFGVRPRIGSKWLNCCTVVPVLLASLIVSFPELRGLGTRLAPLSEFSFFSVNSTPKTEENWLLSCPLEGTLSLQSPRDLVGSAFSMPSLATIVVKPSWVVKTKQSMLKPTQCNSNGGSHKQVGINDSMLHLNLLALVSGLPQV